MDKDKEISKDIIYIDTEDDITSIIGKIKASKDKIIALVPPKRTGALQSAVNLQLLARAAKSDGKKLAVITNNQALMSLAAAAKIPVAKNLQTNPELFKIDALEIDDGEDIIDGSDLPIEYLVKVTDNSTKKSASATPSELKSINIDGDSTNYPSSTTKKSGKNKTKVPNASKFRKKLIIGISAGVVFIAFMVWAIFFAPAATVIIKAKTENAPVSLALSLGGTTATDVNKNVIQSLTKSVTKDSEIEFSATGSKEVGTKATGTLMLYNSGESAAITVPAGATFSNGNRKFTTDKAVSVPGASIKGGQIISGSAEISVTAAEVGSGYNLAEGSYASSVAGITAKGGAMTGGESHKATVVTADDISKARQDFEKQYNNEMKATLKKEFTNGEIVIDDSLVTEYTKMTSSPAEGEEVTSGSKAKLTISAKYTITAIAKSEVEAFLKATIEKQMKDSNNQQIYDNGLNDLKLTNYKTSTAGSTVNLATTGKIGPKIDDNDIKDKVKGKNFGDAQAIVEDINGVNSADIKFSFFWVTTVPNDSNKIKIEFSVDQ